MVSVFRGIRYGVAVAAIIALALSTSGCSGGSGVAAGLPQQRDHALPQATDEQLTQALTDAMAQAGAPGAIAGVWAPWSGRWTQALGTTAPGGAGDPLTTSMPFRIGDLTKPMTCDVVFELVDEGAIGFDDKIVDYYSGVGGVDGLSFAHLCQSTSGLGDSTTSYAGQMLTNPKRQWTPMELVYDSVARLTSNPGAYYVPSDSGYALLGLALEGMTDNDWPTLYNRYIFEPLGLSDTEFPGPRSFDTGGAPGAWQALARADGTLACDAPTDYSLQSNSRTFTAGGVVSTIDDLRIFAQAHAAAALRGEQTQEISDSTVALQPGSPPWQSYTATGAYKLGPMIGQFGSVPGQLSAMLSDPKTGLTVVVMLNNSTAGPAFVQNLAMKLAAIGAQAAPASGTASPDGAVADTAASDTAVSDTAASAGAVPDAPLPWSIEQMNEQLAARAVCQG